MERSRCPRCRLEPTQRTRSLLFLTAGAVFAQKVGGRVVHVYEPGVGALNLPFNGAQVGAQATRAMHPHTLDLTAQLFRGALDAAISFETPFLFFTKGELLRESGPALPALLSSTNSCDEGEGHKQNPCSHCGCCTSCLFRRIAVHAAGLAPDLTPYEDTIKRRHGLYELEAFESLQLRLEEARVFGDLLNLDPDLHYLHAPRGDVPQIEALREAQVVDLFLRYAREIRSFLEQARPTLVVSSDPPHPIARRQEPLDFLAAAG